MGIRKFIILSIVLLIFVTGVFSYVASNSRGRIPRQEPANIYLPAEQNPGDSLNVRLIGRWANGPCLAVDVTGNIACFGNGAYLEIVDFSNPFLPNELSKTLLPATVLAVQINDSYVYVAADGAGLRILSIADPSHPIEIGFFDTQGSASGLDIMGTFVLIADASAGLRIIDVADPYNPREVGAIETNGSALKVAVSGSYAFVADGSGGFLVIDISNPYAPGIVTRYSMTGEIVDAAIRYTYAYVATQNAGMSVINISNPSNLIEIGRFESYTSINAITLSNNYAYVTDSQVGFGIIDISNPGDLRQVGAFRTDGEPFDVAVLGNHAYVADAHRGLRVIDVSNPYDPKETSFFNTEGSSRGVAIQGKYAYLAQREAGLRVIDVSVPVKPVKIGSLNLSGHLNEVKLKENFAFAANSANGIRIIRVSDPAMPVEVGFYEQNIDARSVAPEANYAYIADASFGLRIIDVTDESQPMLIGSFGVHNGQAEDICKQAECIFLAAGDAGLRIIDVSNPAQPAEMGFFDEDGTAKSLAVDGNYVYLGYLQNKLRIINISNPTHPVEIGNLSLDNPANELVVNGRYVYLANGDFGLRVIDVMIPSNPVEVGYYFTGSAAFDVTADDEFIYLVDQNTGLYILEFETATGNIPPQAPNLIVPLNKSFASTVMPQFQWQIPADDNGDLLHFKIQVDGDGDWNNVDFEIDSRSSVNGFSPAPPVHQGAGSIAYASQNQLNERKWHWRVSAWDGLADSDFSDTWTFTIDTTAPVIQQFVFENPGYGDAWFNPDQDTIARAFVSYSELFPERGKLSSAFLPDTMEIFALTGGYNQVLHLQFSITNQSDGAFPVFLSIQDSAGNIGNAVKNIQFDSAPPQDYYSDAPDTVSAGEAYVVRILGANDGLGSGVAEIFLDAFTNFQEEPAVAQDSLVGITEPGIYFYRYFAVDNLGNRGELKTDTTVVVPLISSAPIYPAPQDAEVTAGTEFWMDIVVGTDLEPVQNLFRLSYILNYSNTVFVDAIYDSVLPGSFLGGGYDFDYQVEDSKGEVSVFISEKAGGTDVSGFGTVSRVKFRSNIDTPDQSRLLFALSSISASDVLNHPIELIPGDTSITINQPLRNFTMAVNPDSQAIYLGESATCIARFEPVGEFNSEIAIKISNIPEGMQAIYTDQPFNIPDSINVRFTTTDHITPGVYHPIIAATGGGISHQQEITIDVLEPVSFADFSMAVQTDSQTIFQGERAKFTLSLQPLGGFDSPIELTITNLPAGMNADYPVNPFSIPASFDIPFTTESDIEPGVYYPGLTATGGGITHYRTIKITVRERLDFIMIIRPDSQTVVAGESVEFVISFTPVGGFNSKVSVAISNVPEGMDVIFSSRPFEIPMMFVITFRVPRNFPPDYYFPVITASGGGITHQQTVPIHVLPRNSSSQLFGVQPNPFTPNNDGFNDYAIFNFPETLSGTVTIQIFDINGRKITEIRNSVHWNGKDDKGRDVKPGAYIYMIKDGDKVISKGVVSLAR